MLVVQNTYLVSDYFPQDLCICRVCVTYLEVFPDEHPSWNGYPPTLGGKYPGIREYFRPFWAGTPVTRVTAATPYDTRVPDCRGRPNTWRDVLPMPAAGVSTPGITREYPGSWRKGDASSLCAGYGRFCCVPEEPLPKLRRDRRFLIRGSTVDNSMQI